MLQNKDILRFTIPLLHYCNLSCDYCHVPNERKEYLDFEVYKKGVDFFYESPGYLKNLVLYWWEPLLLKDIELEKFIDYAINKKVLYPEKRFEVTLVTNLTVYRDSLIPILEKLDNLCISIDGTKESHDANRWMFDITFQNFQKIKNNSKIFSGATINKVVNYRNTYTFLEDIKYLLDTFELPISYNAALTVWDWDELSVKELFVQLDAIYNYAKKNHVLHRFQNFFQIAMKSCPFGTLSMWLTGKVYNCEFLSNDYVNTPEPVFDLMTKTLVKTSIKSCFYNYLNQDCINENCLSCGNTCTKFSFQKNNTLSQKQENYLIDVKKARHNHLKYFRETVENGYNFCNIIEVKNLDYKNIFKLYNYSISLAELLFFKDFYYYVDIQEVQIPIFEKLFDLMVKKWEKYFNTHFVCNHYSYTGEVSLDLKTGFVSKNGKYIWNIYSEMNSFL